MTRIHFVVFLLLAALAAPAVVSAAAEKNEIQIGFNTGSNIIPFGQATGEVLYQQIYSRFEFPQSPRIEVREIAFQSNQAISPGATAVNAVVKIATAQAVTNNPYYNMSANQMTVFAGWATTDSSGRLTFDLRRKPFVYNYFAGDLLVQIEVLECQGAGGFMFGPTYNMWRIYTPIGSNAFVAEPAGLNTFFTVKVK
jgi:hypothetical protein